MGHHWHHLCPTVSLRLREPINQPPTSKYLRAITFFERLPALRRTSANLHRSSSMQPSTSTSTHSTQLPVADSNSIIHSTAPQQTAATCTGNQPPTSLPSTRSTSSNSSSTSAGTDETFPAPNQDPTEINPTTYTANIFYFTCTGNRFSPTPQVDYHFEDVTLRIELNGTVSIYAVQAPIYASSDSTEELEPQSPAETSSSSRGIETEIIELLDDTSCNSTNTLLSTDI